MTFRSRTSFSAKVSIASDYATTFGGAPAASDPSLIDGDLWDLADWDVAEWSEGMSAYRTTSRWESISGQGYVLAPQVQILSAGAARVDCELVSVDLSFTGGDPL